MKTSSWTDGKNFTTVCWNCKTKTESEPQYKCSVCGESLDIAYNYEEIFKDFQFSGHTADTGAGIWKYQDLLPVLPDIEPVSLGEGNTPLLKYQSIHNYQNNEKINYSKNMYDPLDELEIYLKMESQNPTLAFKDRPLSVALTAAKQFGFKQVVCASTGNTGVAASAYAARAGIPCKVYVPAATPDEKLAAMAQFGAELEKVEGSFSDAYQIAAEEAEQGKAFNLTSTYLNPYAAEGDKTVAYELVEQLTGRVPDWIIVPIGAGPLLNGIYKGFCEMKLAGYIEALPRMVGVQAEGCAPIAEAYEQKREQVSAWDKPVQSKASGIADPLSLYPQDGTRTLAVVRESNGKVLSIPETELLAWRKLLASRQGILAELSSVTAVAAASKLAADNVIAKGSCVVAIVTGHGLKDMSVTIN